MCRSGSRSVEASAARMTFAIIRPSSLVLYFAVASVLVGFAQRTEAFGGLSDFGGDVSQFMTLLQASSAFRLVNRLPSYGPNLEQDNNRLNFNIIGLSK